MKHKYFNRILMLGVAAGMLTFAACKTEQKISSEYVGNNFATECLGEDMAGINTLRVWGKGKNRAEAIEQAKRNALRDIMFSGVFGGSGSCTVRPLVTEVNAQEKYRDYFNAFFKEGGAWNKYVTLNEKRTSRMSSKSLSAENFGVVVVVETSALRQRLIDDNIIDQ